MKQVVQNLKTGDAQLLEVPYPQLRSHHLIIRSRYSLISAGTERMVTEFAKANWLQKARQQPDKVRMVLNKVKTDGIAATLDTVRSKLEEPLAMGYCNVGEVLEVGPQVQGFAVGDRVISNGKHAEIVQVPQHLCAKVPTDVSTEDAVFTVLGSIALQGIRLAKPTLGENFVVIGLGLVGLLTVQLLRAQGCRVLGVDLNMERLQLAQQFGAEVALANDSDALLAQSLEFSRGLGIDGVLITAATQSNEPVHQAAQMCRKRGRIILVGVTGLQLSRADFYAKELTFQVSCSYGPGRYDPQYEEHSKDYPVGFVRWTEQRNFQAILDMFAQQKLTVTELLTHRFNITDVAQAYKTLNDNSNALGIMLDYGEGQIQNHAKTISFADPINNKVQASDQETLTVSFIGAGNYASRVLMPAFKQANVELKSVVTRGGVTGMHYARKHGFATATTQTQELLDDPTIDAVVIASNHDSHARFVQAALQAKKHVFVEKPLCMDLAELQQITDQVSQHPQQVLMVGFNRRFAPQVVKIKTLLTTVTEPKAFVMTINAPAITADHWTQDPTIGGGRILGEACHFIDLLRFLAGSPIVHYHLLELVESQAQPMHDKVSISLKFADGSIGTIHYLANGHPELAKERLEIFVGGKILQLNNYRKLHGYGWPKFKKMNLMRQDKGQQACVNAFLQAIRSGSQMNMPVAELLEVSRVTIEIARETC